MANLLGDPWKFGSRAYGRLGGLGKGRTSAAYKDIGRTCWNMQGLLYIGLPGKGKRISESEVEQCNIFIPWEVISAH